MSDVSSGQPTELRSAERFSEQQFIGPDHHAAAALTPVQHYASDSFVSQSAAIPPEPAGIRATAARSSGWFWWTAAGLTALLAGLQWYQFVSESWHQSYLQGAAATGLTLCGAGLLVRALLSSWRQRRRHPCNMARREAG